MNTRHRRATKRLRFTTDDTRGITRRRAGTGFSYAFADGRRVTSGATLARIRALAIPPAWTDVWICPNADGHLQATGRDARRRKQYRYHADWRRVRDESKYARMESFARALPRIRARVSHDMRRTGWPREKVLAIVVRLLETTFIRVGNDEYARENRSFGLTTMQDRHVHARGGRVEFRFRGKGRKFHAIALDDRRLARLVKGCRDIPGQQLFQYIDDDGRRRGIGSRDVNEYLREIAGDEFTAKDFRTWGGTLLAAQNLAANTVAASGSAKRGDLSKRLMLAAIEAVAQQLGNTPAICRASYVHPAVLNAFLDNGGRQVFAASHARPARVRGLAPNECALLAFLRAARKGGARAVRAATGTRRAP